MDYKEFIKTKTHDGAMAGFKPTFIPDKLFDFQKFTSTWAIEKGRSGNFYDCGLGKTAMLLTVGQNILEHTNKPVLDIAPLAVSVQTKKEGEKFGIDCEISKDGKVNSKKVIITNYENLHKFDPNDFSGVICDESSAIKSFSGEHRKQVTEFMRKVKYRSLWTATAAPNDYIELGTSSEALGELGYMDMLNMFFKNDLNNSATGRAFGSQLKWRFKGHAEQQFWRWVSSWARAARKPSDLGFDDDNFILPPLYENEHIVESAEALPGMLFAVPATNFFEERHERKNTIEKRCNKAAELVDNNDYSVIWCHLNDEGDYLEKIIPNSVQVSGKNTDEQKEEAYINFANGEIKTLIIKPKIGAFGLNWQHCNHVITFASHSYEQYYQSIRRCWRFGQKRPVTVDTIISEGEARIRDNMIRKAKAADKMFESLVMYMNDSIKIEKKNNCKTKEVLPSWL